MIKRILCVFILLIFVLSVNVVASDYQYINAVIGNYFLRGEIEEQIGTKQLINEFLVIRNILKTETSPDNDFLNIINNLLLLNHIDLVQYKNEGELEDYIDSLDYGDKEEINKIEKEVNIIEKATAEIREAYLRLDRNNIHPYNYYTFYHITLVDMEELTNNKLKKNFEKPNQRAKNEITPNEFEKSQEMTSLINSLFPLEIAEIKNTFSEDNPLVSAVKHKYPDHAKDELTQGENIIVKREYADIVYLKVRFGDIRDYYFDFTYYDENYFNQIFNNYPIERRYKSLTKLYNNYFN